MFHLKFKRVLVLSPHTDDAEIACGGTIVKLIQNGSQLRSIAFSGCEESVPIGVSKRRDEERNFKSPFNSSVKEDNCEVLDFKVRKF